MGGCFFFQIFNPSRHAGDSEMLATRGRGSKVALEEHTLSSMRMGFGRIMPLTRGDEEIGAVGGYV